MIRLIEALNFRCLHHVHRPMDDFHVLVGPNASGKTTFLDVVALLGDLVSGGIEKAVGERTANFQDLTWRREGDRFELAIEAEIPSELRERLRSKIDTIRYEIVLGLDEESGEIHLFGEAAILKTAAAPAPVQVDSFPVVQLPPDSIRKLGNTHRTILARLPGGPESFFFGEPNWQNSRPGTLTFKLGRRKSALANLPEDESRFPVATWFKSLLADGVQRLILNSLLIRQASPPGQGRSFLPDGSNLPWVVADLERRFPDRIQDWISHLQTALPDLETIRTVERADDKHRYLMLGYRGGVEIPSWMISDGTLRLLALTLPAYLPELSGIFLIEEPENGIHPRAVETMFQSLSSVYGAQILLATHSPVILSMVEPEQLLCFAKTEEGATDIVLGNEHPALREWRRDPNLSVLFAAGVLGYGE